MAENKMFCFQCTGDTRVQDVPFRCCGKKLRQAVWQDLLLGVVRGVATISDYTSQ